MLVLERGWRGGGRYIQTLEKNCKDIEFITQRYHSYVMTQSCHCWISNVSNSSRFLNHISCLQPGPFEQASLQKFGILKIVILKGKSLSVHAALTRNVKIWKQGVVHVHNKEKNKLKKANCYITLNYYVFFTSSGQIVCIF